MLLRNKGVILGLVLFEWSFPTLGRFKIGYWLLSLVKVSLQNFEKFWLLVPNVLVEASFKDGLSTSLGIVLNATFSFNNLSASASTYDLLCVVLCGFEFIFLSDMRWDFWQNEWINLHIFHTL